MGKAALIAAGAISLLAIMFMSTTQLISRESGDKQLDYQSGQMARELAMKGHKLVLANWMATAGLGAAPFSAPVQEDGGTYEIPPGGYTRSGDTLDFTVRGIYNGAVHDVRSRYQWNGFGLNPFQLKTAAIDLVVSPSTSLNFDEMIVDDQAINDLDSMLISELGLGTSLEEMGLGLSHLLSGLNDAFALSGHPMSLNVITQADRDLLEAQNGMFFPDQVMQAVDSYALSNPGAQTLISDPTSIPSTFGGGSSMILRIEGNVSLMPGQSLSGQGILVVEGDLFVEAGASLDWDGIVVVKPPDGTYNPVIDFTGNVDINGSLVAIQESIPNAGHMDVTSFRDLSGAWSSPNGADKYQSFWPWWLYHTHDYTSAEGNMIRFTAPTAAERIHEDRHFFFETLGMLNPTDDVYLNIYSPQNHGRGILTMELQGQPRIAYPIAAGFDSTYASPATQFQTQVFKVQDLNYLQIDITRLPSLRKMWDDSNNPFPGCTVYGGTNGAICVGNAYDRYQSLTLQLYKDNGGAPIKVFETSMYWHRQEAEEEEFNNEMQNLLDQLTSENYGFNINLGDSTTITVNPNVAYLLNTVGGGSITVQNLGTWHQHWDAHDPDNPLNTPY